MSHGLHYTDKHRSDMVLNPTTGELVGSFINDHNTSVAAHAVDVANGRVYFLITSGVQQIRAYDINTFLPIGFVNLPFFVSGFARDLVRWGTNGLAFRTDNREFVLIETALVNASIAFPSPTPTPSPTPIPSPPYIPTFVRRLDVPAARMSSSLLMRARSCTAASELY